MSFAVHANVEVYESNATTTLATTTFARRSRRIIIINDDTTDDLLVRVSPSGTDMTLKASEIVTFELRLTAIHLTASLGTVPYRMWVFG